MKRTISRKITFALGATAVLAATSAPAQSVDALLDVMVNKGLITVKEANDLREKSDQDFSTAFASKTGMPDWVTAFKINGDFRGRYEGFYANNPNFVDQNRWRYRARIGFTAVMKENFEVGIKLGSGNLDSGIPTSGVDPISNNQTLQNNGSKKGIFVDQAYAKWTPLTTPDLNGAVTFGKMQNPFVFNSTMLFDNDYTPEGGALQFGYNLGSKHTLNLASGAFILDNNASTSENPFMFNNQLVLNSTWTPKLSTSLGVALLWIDHPNELGTAAVPNINYGNTRDLVLAPINGILPPNYAFNPIVLDASATYTLASFPMYPTAFPITVLGEGLINPAVPGSDMVGGLWDGSTYTGATQTDPGKYGYQAGITFGKAGKKGTWEFSYNWRYQGANSWYEEFTESDFGAYVQYANPAYAAVAGGTTPNPSTVVGAHGYASGTNVKGHIFKLSYSPFDMLTLSATWYRTQVINEQLIAMPGYNWDSSMNRLQIDAILKF